MLLNRIFAGEQLSEQSAKMFAAQLIDIQAKVGASFIGGFHCKNLGAVHTGCQKVRGGHCFANGAGVVENGDFHDSFLCGVVVGRLGTTGQAFTTQGFQVYLHIANLAQITGRLDVARSALNGIKCCRR